MKIEYHPFEPFVPKNSRFFILGSFPGKESTQQKNKDDWFYGAKRNQFWKILAKVYNVDLKTKKDKQAIFEKLKIAITDIIISCERSKNGNLDKNLIHKTYNFIKIEEILKNNKIERILFTSKSVESEFNEQFSNIIEPTINIARIALPSPSPVFRRMTITEKVTVYKQLLPKL